MKVRISYEYEVQLSDGVGTKNDAIIVAIRELEQALKHANSTDDVCAIFEVIIK